MSKFLVTVEETFTIPGRFLVVLPSVSPDFSGGKRIKGYQTISVRLVHKDGTEEKTEAALCWEHINPIGIRLMCIFPSATKEEVPIGTQIWLLNEDAL